MPLILLTLSEAMAAGTAIWLTTSPDPSTDPSAKHLSAADLLPTSSWTDADTRALKRLESELAAVRPMLDDFDGELQIMLRLENALSAIMVIRPEDRALIYEALLFQGLAVNRYFQSGLATEEGAAAYRIHINNAVEVRPWIDAVAMNPDQQPDLTLIPEAPELLQFQELRARHLLRPTAPVTVTLPSGSRLVVDGQEAVGAEALVLQGNHWVSITLDGQVVYRHRFDTKGTSATTIRPPLLAADLAALESQMRDGVSAIVLNEAIQSVFDGQTAPIQLHTGEGRQHQSYTVVGANAVPETPHSAAVKDGMAWRVAVGGGWLYDGDFYLQNAADGAPEAVSTVNAISPLLSVAAEWRLGRPVVGVGIDTLLPTGQWHDLPSGTSRVRVRPYPHLAVGIRPLQITAGVLLPWHIGVGPRTHLMLSEPLGLIVSGAYLYGLPLQRARTDGPAFNPHPVQTAWLSVGISR